MRFSSFFAVFLLMAGLMAGCGKDENEQSPLDTETDAIEENARDVPNKIQNLQLVLAELRNNIESSASAESLQETRATVAEHWDLVDHEIEEQYPNEYVDISQTMDPLLAEAEKEKPDTNKLKNLLDKANEQLTSLLEKASEADGQDMLQ